MLTSKPIPKHRGRQKPKHDVWACPLCFTKLRLGTDGERAYLYCVAPKCEWKE